MSEAATKRVDYRGIEGIRPQENVGAAVTLGIKKGPKGQPINNDRWYIVSPNQGRDGVRPQHPGYSAFNGAGVEHRQTLMGNLVHAEEVDAWTYKLSAFRLPGWPTHPDRRPSCVGDGRQATRYFGKEEVKGLDGKASVYNDFRQIPCPNRLCEFRQGGGKTPCGAFARLYFRIRWPDGSRLRPVIVKWVNHSWNSTENVEGFFRKVEAQAHALGLESYSLYGLPFILTHTRKTKPSEKTEFPVVYMTEDCDLIDFFLAQKRQLRELGVEPPKLLAPGNRTPDENTDEEIFADHAMVTPGHVRKPASVVEEQSSDEAEPETVDGEVEAVDEDPGPTLDERYSRLQSQARGLGLSDSDLQDAIAPIAGNFPDLPPERDADVIRALQERARKAKR